MPPRYAYWTILAGGLPTAFRAAEREDLLPTFKRIQQKHPDAEMKYFAKGKLWESKAEAYRTRVESTRVESKRSRDWRPGGEHRDPRQPFKNAKAKRNLERRKRRFAFKRKRQDASRKP
jgi:hypothetical protein